MKGHLSPSNLCEQTAFLADNARYYYRRGFRISDDCHPCDGAKIIVLEEARKQGGVNQFTMYCINIKKVGDVWVTNRSNEYFKYEDVLAIEMECPSVTLTVPRIPAWGGVLGMGLGVFVSKGAAYLAVKIVPN